jgi:hypothetical protein
MVEVLRNIVSDERPLRHAVIFNFNGAEETNWQAAHGFITQHRWAPSIRAVVNLEAAGTGGRELVFQIGPHHAWLSRIYADSVPRPNANGLAQAIFQSGIIPGETDVVVYKEFGRLPAIDMASVANGHVYHTANDNAQHVPVGSTQRYGDNILALTRGIANDSRMVSPVRPPSLLCGGSHRKAALCPAIVSAWRRVLCTACRARLSSRQMFSSTCLAHLW